MKTKAATARWTPDSWKERSSDQIPEYASQEDLQAVLNQLSSLPPMVTSWEVEALKQQLAEAAAGDRFLLQGGDCSESFDECESSIITNKLKIILQMSLVLIHSSNQRVIRVGRIGGQFAKPRSRAYQTRDGVKLPSYRGDLVNGIEFSPRAREADPKRLLVGYSRAALTLNFIRALVVGGFADLHHPEYWNLDFVSHSSQAQEYRNVVESLQHSLRFFETLSGERLAELQRVEFFTSHEGLHLYYEQAQTRHVPHRTGWYDLSTHFPWIGDRTRQLDGPHVEFFRGVANPIGVKISAGTEPQELAELMDRLNPHDEPGRLTLIHRFGVEEVERALPPLVEEVRRRGRHVLWICDPMHGNTELTDKGLKTRDFDKILQELTRSFGLHRELGSRLGGVHFELTGDNVTECLGGARGLKEADLSRAYKSRVDPRLNYEQALEMAILIARLMI